MKPKARLVIPFWGVAYTHKILDLTLPAVLAPGNLPALCAEFDVELCLVTETRMFEVIRQSKVYAACSALCQVILEPLDDLLTGTAGDYGPVLTFALFRGFVGLKEQMLNYYLLFLCADFVLADGSYRSLVPLMKQGHPVIHCPSFRAVEDDALPLIKARIEQEGTVLAVPPREMVDIALTHRHMTVKARTVNQKLFHQWRMDQFYWAVDDHTLVGYQWPVALVAIKPEVVVEDPVLMFDYGFIPEICPTAEYYFIPDSDQFFMLEMQARRAGEDMLRLGWISDESIIKDLNLWTTREHRICGQQPHIFHSRALPAETEAVIRESKDWMTRLVARLAPPNPHRSHPLFLSWWSGVLTRMKDPSARQPPVQVEQVHKIPLHTKLLRLAATKAHLWFNVWFIQRLFKSSWLRSGYDRLFGKLPRVKQTHVYWVDTHYVAHMLDALPRDAKVLHIGSSEGFFAPLLPQPIEIAVFTKGLLQDSALDGVKPQSVDVCYCELDRDQLKDFHRISSALRPYLKDGGRLYVYLLNADTAPLTLDDASLVGDAVSRSDQCVVRFFGTARTRRLRGIIRRILQSLFRHPMLRMVLYTAAMVGLASSVRAANREAAGRDTTLYTPDWTSLLFEITVHHHQGGAAAGEAGHVG